MDDCLIFGVTKEEHDERLFRVLETIEKAGITLNYDKCEFGKTELSFLGHVIGQGTVQADPNKVKAVLNMKKPDDVSSLRRFLGMVNQLSKFSPKLSNLTQQYLVMGGEPQDIAFEKIKADLSVPPILAQYDPSKETMVTAGDRKSVV